MITPFLNSEKPGSITTSSLVWLGMTTALALVLMLVGAWGMDTAKRVGVLDSDLDSVKLQQVRLDERLQAMQETLKGIDTKTALILEEQQRLREGLKKR